MKNKTDLFFTATFIFTLFLLLISLNNYRTYTHNVDLSFNVFRVVDDFNIKINKVIDDDVFYYINSSNIMDETDYGRKVKLSELYINSIGGLRRIILPIIFVSITFGYSLCYLINRNGGKK